MTNAYAKMTVINQTLKSGTNNVYETIATTEKVITEEEYKNGIDSISFFRRLGGTVHQSKSSTSRGYKTDKLTSISPNRQNKTIRLFDFDVK